MKKTMKRAATCAHFLCLMMLLLPAQAAFFSQKNGQFSLEKIQTQQFAARDAAGYLQIFPPQFEADGKLVWKAPAPVTVNCPEGTAENAKSHARTIWLTHPRVEMVRCMGDDYKKHLSLLVGANSHGKLTWQRPLKFASGEYKMDESVIGVSQQSIVLSNLSVLSPHSGETIHPAPFTMQGKGDSKRPIPNFSFFSSSLYLHDKQGFLIFDADVTLLKREGGLYFFAPATQQKTLWLPVKTTPLGGHWGIEKMLLSPDKQYVLLAKKRHMRGPNKISLAILDVSTKKIVHEELLTNDGEHLDIVEGENGHFGFTFIDRQQAKRVLIHYRLKPKQ